MVALRGWVFHSNAKEGGERRLSCVGSWRKVYMQRLFDIWENFLGEGCRLPFWNCFYGIKLVGGVVPKKWKNETFLDWKLANKTRRHTKEAKEITDLDCVFVWKSPYFCLPMWVLKYVVVRRTGGPGREGSSERGVCECFNHLALAGASRANQRS